MESMPEAGLFAPRPALIAYVRHGGDARGGSQQGLLTLNRESGLLFFCTGAS